MTQYGDDKEWEAAKSLMLTGDWAPETLDATLRMMVQYARSGPFYPADMHVDLIKEAFTKFIIGELDPTPPTEEWEKMSPEAKQFLLGRNNKIMEQLELMKRKES